MRLIDADELKEEFRLREDGHYYGVGYGGYNPICVVNEEPTVEAIPVEWILHYVDTHYNVDNFDGIWRYIMKMHDEWEEENE